MVTDRDELSRLNQYIRLEIENETFDEKDAVMYLKEVVDYVYSQDTISLSEGDEIDHTVRLMESKVPDLFRNKEDVTELLQDALG